MESIIKELKRRGKTFIVNTRKYNGRTLTYVTDKSTGELLAKECNTCGLHKLKEDYHKNKKRFKGVQSHCKSCVKMYYERKREDMLEVFKDNYHNNKEYFDEYYKRDYVVVNTKLTTMSKRAKQTNSFDNINDAELKELLDKERCFLTNSTKDITTDHVIPLSLGGDNSIDNVILLKNTANISKRDRNIFEWYQKYGKKLGVNLERFNNTISYLATLNGLTVDEYRQFIEWAHSGGREEKKDPNIKLIDIWKKTKRDTKTA